jgi:hypothetical protein
MVVGLTTTIRSQPRWPLIYQEFYQTCHVLCTPLLLKSDDLWNNKSYMHHYYRVARYSRELIILFLRH